MPSVDNEKGCHCWVAVFGTILVMISLLDLSLSAVLGSVIAELMEIHSQVIEHSTRLRVGSFFQSITGGLLSLGNTNLGESVEEIVKKLPSLNALMDWTIGRSILAITGIVVGIMMGRNNRTWGHWFVGYGSILLICGVIGVFNTIQVYNVVSSSQLINGSLVLLLISLLIHIAWPMIFVSRMLIARGKNEIKGW